MGEEDKKLPSPPPPPTTSFSHVTSTTVGINRQHFLRFSFNPFATLVLDFKVLPSGSPKKLTLKQDNASKKSGFSGQILIKLRL